MRHVHGQHDPPIRGTRNRQTGRGDAKPVDLDAAMVDRVVAGTVRRIAMRLAAMSVFGHINR
jgi:hypothetical protein